MSDPSASDAAESPHFVPGTSEMALALIVLPETALRMDALTPLGALVHMQHFQAFCLEAVDAHGGEAVRAKGTSVLAAWKAGDDGFSAACDRACRAAWQAVFPQGGKPGSKKKPEPWPGTFAAVCGGECGFFTRDGRIVNVVGEPVVRLERYAALAEDQAGRVLVDASVRAAAPELCFDKLAMESDELYLLTGITG